MKGLDVCAGNSSSDLYVIDGGCLLHRVKWSQTRTYADVVQQYLNYVRKHFGCNCIVVFDGYCNGPSIKDHEHQKRAVKSCSDITVEEFKPVHHNQSVFLTNEYNKKGLIALLTEHFN
jgi:hypothetical protein